MSLASARELIPACAPSLPAATVLPCTALGEALRHAAHKLGQIAQLLAACATTDLHWRFHLMIDMVPLYLICDPDNNNDLISVKVNWLVYL